MQLALEFFSDMSKALALLGLMILGSAIIFCCTYVVMRGLAYVFKDW